jgi:Tfp pilus assembly protein PilO
MEKNRIFLIGAVLAMAVIVLFGFLIGVQPQLAAAAAAQENAAAARAKNAASANVLAGLKRDYATLDVLKQQRDALRKAIPASTDMSSFIAEIHVLQVDHGVALTAFNVTDGQAYLPAKAATPATAPAATPATAPAATAVPASSAGVTSKNFTLMPIQLTVSGQNAKVLNFVHGLQTGTRLMLVTTLSISPVAAGSSSEVSASIGGFAYVLSDTAPGPPAAG